MIECIVAGEGVALLPQKAMYWRRTATLFIADFHLGKAAAFRSAGIPLPSGTTTDNVTRLSAAVVATGAKRVVFLGDFLHAKASKAPQTEARFGAWRDAHRALELVLVRGNHDKNAGDPCVEWDIACIEEGAAFGPFIANHHPETARGGYVLAGHIHPAVLLSDDAGSMRLPCFWFSKRVGILPAFGAFTGTATVRPRVGDQVFVIADGEVITVQADGCLRSAG
jgi:DNA ligase-associated metallophosphoesterase